MRVSGWANAAKMNCCYSVGDLGALSHVAEETAIQEIPQEQLLSVWNKSSTHFSIRDSIFVN